MRTAKQKRLLMKTILTKKKKRQKSLNSTVMTRSSRAAGMMIKTRLNLTASQQMTRKTQMQPSLMMMIMKCPHPMMVTTRTSKRLKFKPQSFDILNMKGPAIAGPFFVSGANTGIFSSPEIYTCHVYPS